MEAVVAFPSILLIVGLAYVVIFGGLALLRREGLSLRFAVESIVLTILVAALALAGVGVHPVIFLFILYLVTMRVRLLVELATIFAKRGRFETSERLFTLALRLWPDQTSRLIVMVNHGTSLLQQGRLDEALAMYKEILDQKSSGFLGRKYEAAAHYNLGVVYLRKNMEGQATVAFNSAIDTLPASEYARRAARALEQQRHKGNPEST
jgi:tetratricopeptide (TPR) repeat protein